MVRSQTTERRVLLVDDSPEIVEYLGSILADENIVTGSAADGSEALDRLDESHYDAILCDIRMPKLDGLNCLAEAQIRGHLAPFVFVTGSDDQDKMLQAIRLGAMDFIKKPFIPEEVLDVTFRALEVGTRRMRILQEAERLHPQLHELIKKEEKMIALMRVKNSRARAS